MGVKEVALAVYKQKMRDQVQKEQQGQITKKNLEAARNQIGGVLVELGDIDGVEQLYNTIAIPGIRMIYWVVVDEKKMTIKVINQYGRCVVEYNDMKQFQDAFPKFVGGMLAGGTELGDD